MLLLFLVSQNFYNSIHLNWGHLSRLVVIAYLRIYQRLCILPMPMVPYKIQYIPTFWTISSMMFSLLIYPIFFLWMLFIIKRNYRFLLINCYFLACFCAPHFDLIWIKFRCIKRLFHIFGRQCPVDSAHPVVHSYSYRVQAKPIVILYTIYTIFNEIKMDSILLMTVFFIGQTEKFRLKWR